MTGQIFKSLHTKQYDKFKGIAMGHFVVFILSALPLFSYGQKPCIRGFVDSRPDTVTRYDFIDTIIHVADIKGAKVLSRTSFRTKQFTILWLPISTPHIDVFMARTLNSTRLSVSDTLSATFFRKDYIVYMSKADGRSYQLLCFQNKNGRQDIFWMKPRFKKMQPQMLLSLVESILK